MKTRTLGQALEVSALGLGCMGLDLAGIETAAAAIEIQGERYPAHILATTGL